jgi:hypothetical protein
MSKPDPRYVNPNDEQNETPVTERFDWKSVKILCVEGIPKHKAYGMLFEEYARQREMVSEHDTTERKRLSFYLPLLHSMFTSEYAALYNVSLHKFMILILELGLIHFQHDYYDDYRVARQFHGKAMLDRITSPDAISLFMKSNVHKIELGSCMGSRIGKAKHYTPAVPEWLYLAVTDSARYLGMTVSDFVFLCWAIGMQRGISDSKKNAMLSNINDELLKNFNFEFVYYCKNIRRSICDISGDK